MRSEGFRDILPVGYSLHWYELLEVLGRGGYGVTYLAMDRNLRRNVAIKEYLPLDFACRESNDTVHPITDSHNELYNWGLERFLVEARTLAKFNHHNIIRVLSVFEHNNTAYMVMEYEEGSDLSVIYQEKAAATEAELLPVFMPIIEGLSLVHQEGFIHRDIKPSNIYVRSDGSAVLLDFGSARQTLSSRTRALTSLITAGYAPFEQYNESEEEQGAWTDIYGLGSTLYFCITGEKPADALKRGSSLIKQGYDVYEPVSRLAPPGFSPHFLMAIDHALMFHAEARPQTALQWADMLSGDIDVPPLPANLYVAPDREDVSPDKGDASNPVSQISAGDNNAVHSADNEPLNKQTIFQQKAGESSAQPIVQATDDDSTRVQIRQPAHGASVAQPPQLPDQPGNSHRHPVDSPTTMSSPAMSSPPLAYSQSSQIAGYFQAVKKAVMGRQKVALAVVAGFASMVVVGVVVLSAGSSTPLSENPTAGNSDILVQGPVDEDTAIDDTDSNVTPEKVETPAAHDMSPSEKMAKAEKTLINGLLRRAKLNIAANRYIAPEENNALYQYEKILVIEPDHPDAIEGLQGIAAHYAALVDENIEAGQWEQAQAYFSNLERVPVETDALAKLQIQFEQYDKALLTIRQNLDLARHYLSKNQLTRPATKNALAMYNKVLALDPDNAKARAGLDRIVRKLSGLLNTQLKAGEISRAEATFDKIEKINPDAEILNKVESKLSAIVAKRNKIKKLLSTAERDFIRGRLIAPNGNNALDRYRRVLTLSPGNKQAIAGVERVYDYYLSQYNQHLSSKAFDKAAEIIQTLSSLGYGEKRSAKLTRQMTKKRQTLENEPQVIIALLAELKISLEKRDLKRIETISYFNKGKKKLFRDLFEKYPEFTVKVLKTSHDINLHKATARIEIENLVDHWEDEAGKSEWVSVDVSVSQDENSQWIIYW